MKSRKKQPFVITGSMVTRAVQVLAILLLVWELLADMLKIQSLDSHTIVLLICSIAATEAGLQGQKKRKIRRTKS